MNKLDKITLSPSHVKFVKELGIHQDWKKLCAVRSPTFEQQAFYCILRGRPITTMIARKNEKTTMMRKMRGKCTTGPANTTHPWERVVYKIIRMSQTTLYLLETQIEQPSKRKRWSEYWYQRCQVEFPFQTLKKHNHLMIALYNTLSKIYTEMNEEHWALC